MVKREKVVLEGSMESSRDKFRREVKVRKVRVLLLKELLKRLQN